MMSNYCRYCSYWLQLPDPVSCVSLSACLSFFVSEPDKISITAHVTFIRHRGHSTSAWYTRTWTHLLCATLLLRLSQYQTSPVLVLWEAQLELSGHTDWRKISLQISCGQKIWLMPNTGQWMVLTHIKYIRMRRDNVPAGLRRVFLL